VAITVSAVDDAPINTVPGAQTVLEDTALNISGLSVADGDGNLASTQLSVTNGSVTVTVMDGATISAGANSSGSLTLSGSEAAINASLATLNYQGNLNFNGSDTLTVLSTDSTGTPLSDSDTVAIIVAPMEEAPVNTVPGAQTVVEDNALNLTGISVNDFDGDLATTQLTVTEGTLSVSLSSGVTISAGANDSASLTLSGTQGGINATLSSLTYQGALNFFGSDVLTITSTDSGIAPLSDVDTIPITVSPEPIAYEYFDSQYYHNNLGAWGFNATTGLNSNTPTGSGRVTELDPTLINADHTVTDHNYYAIRYETIITVTTAGNYDFKLKTDDGGLLYVDLGATPTLAIGSDQVQGITTTNGTIYLTAGEHTILIHYFQDIVTQVAELEIRGPDTGGNYVDLGSLTSVLRAPPIVIDLDGDGVEFISLDAGYSLDMTDSGGANITAFAAPDDAVLVFDADHNGLVSNTREFMFADYIEGASTDLEGLRFFDSNNDGFLSSEDNLYSDFHLWQDANLNGEVDTGEFISLSEAGLVSIGLTSDGEGYADAGGSVWVHGTAQAQFSDGRSADVADAVFDYLPDAGVNLNLTDLSDKFMATLESNTESNDDNNSLNVDLTDLLDIADHNSWLTGLEGSDELTTSEVVDQVNDTLLDNDLNNDATYNDYTSEDSVNETLSSFNQYIIYTIL
jgi:hypothetical protein